MFLKGKSIGIGTGPVPVILALYLLGIESIPKFAVSCTPIQWNPMNGSDVIGRSRDNNMRNVVHPVYIHTTQ